MWVEKQSMRVRQEVRSPTLKMREAGLKMYVFQKQNLVVNQNIYVNISKYVM